MVVSLGPRMMTNGPLICILEPTLQTARDNSTPKKAPHSPKPLTFVAKKVSTQYTYDASQHRHCRSAFAVSLIACHWCIGKEQ
jgi:hypothetical protein